MTEQNANLRTEQKLLSFGNWSVILRGDELADIRYRNHLVLRSLRAVVRDSDWNTAAIRVFEINSSNSGINMRVTSEGYGSSFEGTVKFSVSENTAHFAIDLLSQKSFHSNRTGIIVLHSPKDAGSKALVTEPSGNTTSTVFPKAIDPNQPMENIKSLQWSRNGVQTTLSFEGEVFETEDQRNWTDASFKTYSRPLSEPFPFEITAGEQIKQSVQILVEGEPDIEAADGTLLNLDKTIRAPRFSLLASNASDPAPEFSELGSALCLELDLSTPNWKAAADRARTSNLPIDLRLVVADEHSETDVLEAIDQLRDSKILTIAAFDKTLHVTTESTQLRLVGALEKASKTIGLVAGARSHFTELNRNQTFPRENLSAVCFSSTPMFHSRDTAQLIEAVAMQRLTVENAIRIADGIPVHVGPITLRPRFNNVATTLQPGPARSDLQEGYGAQFTGLADPRQSAEELAAWSIAAFCAFAVESVESIIWFEQWGPRGVVGADGVANPVMSAMKILAEIAGKEIVINQNPDNLVWAVGIREDNQLRVLAANLNDHSEDFEVSLDGITKSLKLDAFSFGTFDFN